MTGALSDLLVRSTLMLAATGVLALLVRRRAASVQALVLTSALASSLVLPVAASLMPAWEVPIAVRRSIVETVEDAAAPVPEIGTPSEGLVAPELERPAPAIASAAERRSGAAEVGGPAASVGWIAAGLWLSGVLVLGLRLVRSHRHLSRLVGRARAVSSGPWREAASRAAGELGLGRAVSVKVSAELSVPIVAGVWWPTLVLPEEAADWPVPVAHDVMRHELAHVIRWDAAGQVVGQLACAAYWFNPLVWFVAARAATLRERACDDEVLRAGTRASDYASRLLDLARLGPGREPLPAALAMASTSRIRERVVCVLDPATRRGRPGGIATLTTTIGIGAVATAVALAQPVVRAATVLPTAPLFVRDAPVQSASPATLCSGRVDSSSSSINDEGRGRRWHVKLKGPDCDIDLRVEGRIEFNDDFTDVASLDRDGLFRLDAADAGVRRRLEIRSRDGALVRTYEVDGRTRDWDAEARGWFGRFLIALDRRTAVAVDVRLPILLRSGGPAAVLAETAEMPSDYARSRYYIRLLDRASLSVAERRQLLEQAATLTRSDYYASQLLTRLVREGRLEDAPERQAVIDTIRRMDSDYYRAASIKALAGASLPVEQSAALLDVLASMDSDYYRSQVLAELVRAAPADADLATATAVIGRMDSDHYRAQAITVIARRGDVSRQASALMALAGDMDSDYYRRAVLGELLGASLSESDLLEAVRLIRRMRSDHYQAAALGEVIANRGATQGVRSAVRDAAEGLSRHYRQQVLRQIDR